MHEWTEPLFTRRRTPFRVQNWATFRYWLRYFARAARNKIAPRSGAKRRRRRSRREAQTRRLRPPLSPLFCTTFLPKLSQTAYLSTSDFSSVQSSSVHKPLLSHSQSAAVSVGVAVPPRSSPSLRSKDGSAPLGQHKCSHCEWRHPPGAGLSFRVSLGFRQENWSANET